MGTSPDNTTAYLVGSNAPWYFWRLLDERVSERDWCRALDEAVHTLLGSLCLQSRETPSSHLEQSVDSVLAQVLGEGQFGPRHWQLSTSRRTYYDYVRPFLPAGARSLLRRLSLRRQGAAGPLGWPVEDRYVRLQYRTVRRAMELAGLVSAPYVHFWPYGKRFALVLTHDIESEVGQAFVRDVAALEESYGFRSSFNFVAEQYQVDEALQGELRERGFEVGVHGLKHDGKLFSSEEGFREQVWHINRYERQWDACGFRSPMTHRQPEWMQALDIEYDSSFFDTDPFEPIPGGTMSIWPFMLGHFVELPYTLCQDHTLLSTLGEKSAHLWIEKASFIEEYHGMALLNTHPDYLLKPEYFTVYEQFLRYLRTRGEYWHVLPREVARWWRRRMQAVARPTGSGWQFSDLPEAHLGQICPCADGEGVSLELQPVAGRAARGSPVPAGR